MHRTTSHFRGFTLVELLVVIAIIGVLMGLLLPAVQGAREAGRRVTCTNNQYQIALACTRFNDTNGFLPGWRNTVGTGTHGWPVMLTPFIERNDIWRTALSGAIQSVFISMFVCPSSPPDAMTSPWIAYAGNCGTGGANADVVRRQLTNGVMVDNVRAPRRGLDEIPDGTSMTLLISEKCNTSTGSLPLKLWNANPQPSNNDHEFFQSENFPGFGIQSNASGTVQRIINSGSLGPPGLHSQPSSNHPGGAVVAFCDGRTGFLKDSLQQHVYGRLITSDGLNASSPASDLVWSGASSAAETPPLSEGDFQ